LRCERERGTLLAWMPLSLSRRRSWVRADDEAITALSVAGCKGKTADRETSTPFEAGCVPKRSMHKGRIFVYPRNLGFSHALINPRDLGEEMQ
jgi:hypothetical protein